MPTNKEEALSLIAHARKLAGARDGVTRVELVILRSTLEEAERLVTDLQEVKRARKSPGTPQEATP